MSQITGDQYQRIVDRLTALERAVAELQGKPVNPPLFTKKALAEAEELSAIQIYAKGKPHGHKDCVCAGCEDFNRAIKEFVSKAVEPQHSETRREQIRRRT